MMRAVGGCLPDPVDKRDKRFGDLVSLAGSPLTLPREKSLRRHVHSVLDQGDNASTCSTNAWFNAIRIRRSAMGHKDPLAARLFGYFVARATHDMAHVDMGTFNRAVAKGVNQYGLLPEASYKYGYDTSKINTPPPPVAYRRAFDNRTPENKLRYHRMFDVDDALIDRIMQSIALDMPVVFGTDVTNDFARNRGLEYVLEPPNGSDIAGGHAMVIIGYNDKGHFEILNSYGPHWGLNGYLWMSAAYLKWAGSRDFWSVEHPPALELAA